MILLIGLGIIVAVVFMDQGQRRIPIQYAKRVVGRRMTSGGSTYLPLKVNQAGVIPIIFATSVLYFPTLLASVIHASWFQNFVTNYVNNQKSLVYMAMLTVLIVFFAYFYTAIQFDPVRTRGPDPQAGRVHPGHPARTADGELPELRARPHHASGVACSWPPSRWSPRSCSRTGRSTSSRSEARPSLITVGVALETMKQIESQLMMRHYEGFLK